MGIERLPDLSSQKSGEAPEFSSSIFKSVDKIKSPPVNELDLRLVMNAPLDELRKKLKEKELTNGGDRRWQSSSRTRI